MGGMSARSKQLTSRGGGNIVSALAVAVSGFGQDVSFSDSVGGVLAGAGALAVVASLDS